MSSLHSSEEVDHLTTLPNEILHNIFQWAAPGDLATLPQVCRALYGFIRGNHKLYRDIYLNILDEPPNGEALDWEAELRDLAKLQTICRREEVAKKENELDFVYGVVNRLLKNASPTGYAIEYSDTQYASKNADILDGFFREETNRVAFLQKSSLFERVYKSQDRCLLPGKLAMEVRQQSAKLHCLRGQPILNVGRLRSTSTYPYACSKVYDLRNYTTLTKWGPFMDDESGRVDWEKVEAILVVLGNNVMSKRLSRVFNDIWESPFTGSWPKSFISSPASDISSLDAIDPYGITGTWYRVVCFLDYNDFFSFNYPPSEAMRAQAFRPPSTIVAPGPEYHQDYPVVHFKGCSRPLDDAWDDNASSAIRGVVGMTKEGEVRWTTYSIFHGQERWKSEGVQIGGMRSARGVVGNWFDRDYDPHGPVGPTAFWKASDDENARDLHAPIHALIPSEFLLWGTLIEMAELADSDPEGDMDFTIQEEDDDDVEENESGSELIDSELPDLLIDAQLEIIEVTHEREQA
ncbi:hypothetical protein PT974_01019 [Cladobotryum mycophilum]|uniref:F-box domain-containing protein n=1 Tax=Cladobotryum mycophilum TaxID=491253 RepID=A0ABR0T2H8_9HYPO